MIKECSFINLLAPQSLICENLFFSIAYNSEIIDVIDIFTEEKSNSKNLSLADSALENFVYAMYIYRVSGNNCVTSHMQVKRVKLSRKIIYRFSIFAIINEKLTKIDWSMRADIWVRREKTTHYDAVSRHATRKERSALWL